MSLSTTLIYSQKIEVNVEGEKIVRFDDGSWRYFEPADSIYEARLLIDQKKGPKQSLDKFQEQIIELKKELTSIEREIYSLRKRRKEINQSLINTSDAQKIIELNTDLQNVIRSEKQSEQLFLDLTNELENIQRLQKVKPEQREEITFRADQVQVKNGNIEYNKNREVPIIPEHILNVARGCTVKKKKDDLSKLVTTSVQPDQLFSYTPEGLSSYLGEKGYIQCYASIMHIQGRFFLNLRIDIANLKAQQSYGYLAKKGQLILQLLNGDTYALINTTNSIGTVLPSDDLTRYEANYAIDPRVLNMLEKYGLDKIRIVWSTGYEDYEIYDVDVLLHQVNCISSKL